MMLWAVTYRALGEYGEDGPVKGCVDPGDAFRILTMPLAEIEREFVKLSRDSGLVVCDRPGHKGHRFKPFQYYLRIEPVDVMVNE